MGHFVAIANAHVADSLRFMPQFRTLALSWTANAMRSRGMDEFVDDFLPKIRLNNPDVEYKLHRTNTLCDPFVVGTYIYGRQRKMRCCYSTPEQILIMVEQMSIGGDYRMGRKRGVSMNVPRGLQIWDTETKGHDIYEIQSKYKADPPPPYAIKTKDHPHYIFRFQT